MEIFSAEIFFPPTKTSFSDKSLVSPSKAIWEVISTFQFLSQVLSDSCGFSSGFWISATVYPRSCTIPISYNNNSSSVASFNSSCARTDGNFGIPFFIVAEPQSLKNSQLQRHSEGSSTHVLEYWESSDARLA
ncbi:uncharacterized protein LOC18028824 isoform X2 [Eutrema salsugineum]|uniref:uncharacterized protein LOC18028824 isoform X2 n=1 Tax=Eutrema salsugineum TaxID=72664 RepID=UPI000CED23A5|nr:uncharacterized protein LOC18028824 isoform X2 [Eutrema salsugineum]